MASRRFPVGAEYTPDEGTRFRVWAPKRRRVAVVLEEGQPSGRDAREVALDAEGGGYFSGLVREAAPGARYRFRLDGADRFPDPASRFQPEGPHGPSVVVDPTRYRWSDAGWKGRSIAGQVIYEMHVGTFTREGTWDAAGERLRDLVDTGVTVVEVMPIADFPGRFGWGYDGVALFAPTRLYGTPDDLRGFVDDAHERGLAVILDVVYNHLGPDGNYLTQYADAYFTDRHVTDWGDPINFDGEDSGPVREFYLANARYWIDEFHFDGLRLDATQNVYDEGPEHILAAVVREVRAAAGGRRTIVVGENEPQQVRLVKPKEQGGFGMDALWNDDLHHSAQVLLSGRNEAYYTDYLGAPQEFVSAMKYGYLYQGQWYKWQKQRRGTPAFGLPRPAFVNFIQNHDQVANSARGLRSHQIASPGRYRAMTALILLGPGTPMLFQGQEFAASAPFLYFADHAADLAAKVRAGRREFLAQWPSLARPEWDTGFADPADRRTFERCKLDHAERDAHAEASRLHRDLLRLRREDPVIRGQAERGIDGAVLGPDAFVLRLFGEEGLDRLLLVNFGRDLHLNPAPEPLLAPPEGREWRVLWSSEDRVYGGCGILHPDTEDNWRLPGEATLVLAPGDPR
jgi:maltooligosyltrehalose trehalohydrolase